MYLTVGKEVSLTFSGKKKNEGRLEYITLSVNKLVELINNNLVDRESILDVERVSLIVRTNFKKNVLIDATKTRKYSEGKDIFTNGNFRLFVDESQYLSHEEMYVLAIKNLPDYESESDPKGKKRRKAKWEQRQLENKCRINKEEL